MLMQVNGNNKLRIGLKAKNNELFRDAVEFYTKAGSCKQDEAAFVWPGVLK